MPSGISQRRKHQFENVKTELPCFLYANLLVITQFTPFLHLIEDFRQPPRFETLAGRRNHHMKADLRRIRCRMQRQIRLQKLFVFAVAKPASPTTTMNMTSGTQKFVCNPKDGQQSSVAKYVYTILLPWQQRFSGDESSPFCEKYFGKRMICRKFPVFSNRQKQTKRKQIAKNRHNCLKYESVLQIFYFHILNLAKFG